MFSTATFLWLTFAVWAPEAKPLAKRYYNSTESSSPLAFRSDGTFQISVFEDLHFGENAWDTWGPQQDINSVKVLNKVLDAESPGLVVLNGDLITGENTYLENSTTYIDQIIGPIVDRGLTWASTYGNHDYDFNISGITILAREKRWPNSRTTQMVFNPEAGVSNYYLPVYDGNCTAESCAPELLLWFFDSRGGFLYQQRKGSGDRVGQPNWIDISVVNWFRQKNAEFASTFGRVIPSLAFCHIPTFASRVLQAGGVDPNTEPGINDDYPVAPQAEGWCPDGVNDGSCSYGGQDIPFMQAISEVPGVMALFSGHDHGDTWCYKWDKQLPNMTIAPRHDVNLCFGQHSGYGGYGNWERGARQILVFKSKLKNLEVDTWIRLEGGSIVGSVSLNGTYGIDRYPATNNTKTYCPTCDYNVVTPM
ncbi:Metallo-dependent phosphatase [Durotheca rogersii]|uniref:Metallo-dependent phosphatase n=1 Tax=Durotheca rogersii TaxID=419775 RepID=UPI00222010A4|nr:Metallo-dependent phosphatase [Durotheca rogersii]KAI5862972.1 Metallo-dependent phosphatase [Durotheca rogersii]